VVCSLFLGLIVVTCKCNSTYSKDTLPYIYDKKTNHLLFLSTNFFAHCDRKEKQYHKTLGKRHTTSFGMILQLMCFADFLQI